MSDFNFSNWRPGYEQDGSTQTYRDNAVVYYYKWNADGYKHIFITTELTHKHSTNTQFVHDIRFNDNGNRLVIGAKGLVQNYEN